MSNILFFGDIHFSSIIEWNYKAGEGFIKWFSEQNFGNKEDTEVVFAGDIAERDVNPGSVTSQIYRFFEIVSRMFKSAYIIIGNHDKKLYHEIEQHSLAFLPEAFPNIHVYEELSAIETSNGASLLLMPWQRMSNGVTLHNYYSNLPKDITDKKYDAVVGHWNIKESNGPKWMSDGVDISNIKANCYAIGHIHLRLRDEYLGSCWANNVSEYNPKYPRGYKVYNIETKSTTFVKMPDFLKYNFIDYGDTIVEDTESVNVYTVRNCIKKSIAQEKYPNSYIRGIEKPINSVLSESEIESSMQSVSANYKTDLVSAFKEMVKETKLNLSEDANSIILRMLEEKANS